MKQQFLKGKAGTIRLSSYSSNVAQVPSSATIVLKKPSGEELQASTAATVNSTTGEMTYALTTTHTADHDLNYIAEWTFVISGETYYETQLFDVVKSILSISITDDDLFSELESLRETQKQDVSTATSATSSTVVDTAERKESDDYWNGGTIEIISGTGVDQMRGITDFVQSTSTITVSPNWVTSPDSTSKYKIVKSYTNKIEQAFKEIETMLYNQGRRHSLILESSQIEFPLLYLSLHKICLDLMSEEGDKWFMLAEKYKEKYEKAFSDMKVEYDTDESGTIDSEEEQQSTSQIRLYRA